MIGSWVPFRGQGQPPVNARINWRHPLAQHLRGFWLANNPGAHHLFNYAQNKPDAVYSAAAPFIVASPTGDIAHKHQSGSSRYMQVPNVVGGPLDITGAISVAGSWRKASGTSGGRNPILTKGGTTGNGYALDATDDGSGLRWWMNGAGINPAFTPAANTDYIFCGTFAGGTGGRAAVYSNGALIGSGTANNPIATTVSLQFAKRDIDSSPLGSIDRHCKWYAVWARALTAAEVALLSAQPYCMFEVLQPVTATVAAAGAVTHTATGALAGAGSSIVGSATHLTLHTGSGSLQGQGASVVGSATHLTLHTATGVLAGAGSAIVGAAEHTSASGSHDASGALQGAGASVVGSATHLTLHTATGTLQGAGSAVVGAASHLTLHTASGTLQGEGSAVVSIATHSGQGAQSTETFTGGWPTFGRVRSKEEIDDERRRLGILPPKVVKDIERVTKAVTKADPKADRETLQKAATKRLEREIGQAKAAQEQYRQLLSLELERLEYERQEEEAIAMTMIYLLAA